MYAFSCLPQWYSMVVWLMTGDRASGRYGSLGCTYFIVLAFYICKRTGGHKSSPRLGGCVKIQNFGQIVGLRPLIINKVKYSVCTKKPPYDSPDFATTQSTVVILWRIFLSKSGR